MSNTKLGLHTHTAEVRKIMEVLMEEAIANNPEQGPTQSEVLALTLHPRVIDLMGLVDEELYIAEYVVETRNHLTELANDTLEGAKELIELATTQLNTMYSEEQRVELERFYGDLMKKCYDALFSSYN